MSLHYGVLAFIRESGRSWTVDELARELDLPRPVVDRIVADALGTRLRRVGPDRYETKEP